MVGCKLALSGIAPGGSRGSVIVKVEPCPTSEAMVIWPPCSRMIFCETGKPEAGSA